MEDLTVGKVLSADFLKAGDMVDMSAVSKGKGFQGGVKRWHYRGGDATHGSMFHRAPGSIGQSAWPSRVFKGKRMAGRYGHERSTMRNVKLVRIDAESNMLLVRGAIPGPNGGYVLVRKTNKLD